MEFLFWHLFLNLRCISAPVACSIIKPARSKPSPNSSQLAGKAYVRQSDSRATKAKGTAQTTLQYI